MRENNPFEDTAAGAGSSNTNDQASANAMNALNEPKKSSGFFGALKNLKKTPKTPSPDNTQQPTEPASADAQPTVASDFSGSDTSYSPLINETQTPIETPAQNFETEAPAENSSASESFQKRPPVAIDGVSPDYNAPQASSYQPTAQYEQPTQTAPTYEDFQPVEQQPYTQQQEQPMIYQQPYQQQDYYQQQTQTNPYASNTNQPLPVNYNTTSNVYDPYNPYATMVDLNPNAPDPNKKPDWKFIITFSIAIICFAGMIFFAISYAGANSLATQYESDYLQLKNNSTDSTKAANQIEDLNNTIRDLNSKNEDLTKTNDELKKNEDKIKDLEAEKVTLQADKQEWQDKYYETLTKCGEKCAGTSSSD